MRDALKDLQDFANAVYRREFDRAHKEWPMLPHPEFADSQFNEANQLFQMVYRLVRREEERTLDEIRRLGT
jgi:hypothetical protein